ncbi:MAG: GTP-binding protein [Terrimicrobiaceae bacterium]
MDKSKPLGVYLVTGFLGSGKTTLLKQIATSHPDRKIMFLVNELAERDVDGGRLAGVSGFPVQAIVGGSLFCECVAADFLQAIQREVLPRHRDNGLDALVIETSGMSDPGAIGTLIAQSGLTPFLEVCQVITVVPTPRAASLLQNLPVANEQVRLAGVVVLSKADLATEDQKILAVETVRATNPSCRLHWADHGCVDDDILQGHRHQDLKDSLSTCDDNPFTAWVLECPAKCSRELFCQWLDHLPHGVLRVKGELDLDQERVAVDWTPDAWDLQETPAAGEPGLIAIVHDDDGDLLVHLAGSLRELER